MKKKVYEVPSMLVHSLKIKPIMQTGSGGNDGTGSATEESRRFWLDDEDNSTTDFSSWRHND